MPDARKLVEVKLPGAVGGQVKLTGVIARAAFHTMMRNFHSSVLYRWRYAGPTPERLLIAPPDLRTADPTIANELMAGTFVFAGQVIEAIDHSPFDAMPPSQEWLRELNGFGWLRHLKIVENATARRIARDLVEDWIMVNGKWDDLAWEPDIVSTRIIAWLAQSPLVLQDSDQTFYNAFLKSMNRQVRYLRRIMPNLPPGKSRLKAAIALASATLSLSGQKRYTRSSARRLDEELNFQILPDGGHVSRSPGAIVDILTDLLPLRQAFTARGLEPTKAVMTAIDRMMPMLRFYRHSDGAFAHFNGMGGTQSDLIATLLAYDDARGKPVLEAKYTGYCRMEAGNTTIIADTGAAPPIRMSQSAHAGTLSFEFSSNRQRIITNCGAPPEHMKDWAQLTRATAAHSTLVMNDTSSARFVAGTSAEKWLGPVMVSGPEDVRSSIFDNARGHELVMSHDGYAASFGVVHERTLILEQDGKSLFGIDTLVGLPVRGYDEFAIRFHIHPTVSTSMAAGGESVFLALPNGEAWEFEATPGVELVLEESIYMSATFGHRRSEQIVIYGNASQMSSVTWSFVQAGSSRSRPLSDVDLVEAQRLDAEEQAAEAEKPDH
ncbi:MAG: heparinase [Hyphomicrobiales bacterium]|nr:MAG: heparinase [Hyphomicrobiales bacterium]